MQRINRDLFILKAKQPFVDWLRSIPDLEMPNATLEDVNFEEPVFLVPEGSGEDDARHYIKQHQTTLAQVYFSGWYTDESTWPDLENESFDRWFTLEYHSLVQDLVIEQAITKDIGTRALGDQQTIDLSTYKNRIIVEFDRHGDWGTPEAPNMLAANRAIDDYRQLTGDVVGILDLQLTFIESGTGYTERYGDIDEPFYEALEIILEDFANLLKQHPTAYEMQDFGSRLRKLQERAGWMGWGYGDAVTEMVQDVLRFTGDI